MAHAAFLEWVGNAKNPPEIEYLLALDDDDEAVPTYINLFTEADKNRVGRFELSVNSTRSIIQAVNLTAPKMSSTSELFSIVSDDIGTPVNWDEELFKVLDGVDNFKTPKIIGVNDAVQAFGTFYIYIANKAYYTKLGYVIYPEYDGLYADNDNKQVAEILGAIMPAPHLTFEHRNYCTGKTAFDRTYAKHNNPENRAKNLAVYQARIARRFDL